VAEQCKYPHNRPERCGVRVRFGHMRSVRPD
jgi:hypothetical protein